MAAVDPDSDICFTAGRISGSGWPVQKTHLDGWCRKKNISAHHLGCFFISTNISIKIYLSMYMGCSTWIFFSNQNMLFSHRHLGPWLYAEGGRFGHQTRNWLIRAVAAKTFQDNDRKSTWQRFQATQICVQDIHYGSTWLYYIVLDSLSQLTDLWIVCHTLSMLFLSSSFP